MGSDSSRNVLFAVILSLAVLFLWEMFYVAPQAEKAQERMRIQKELRETETPAPAAIIDQGRVLPQGKAALGEQLEEVVARSIPMASPSLTGSINLKGARLDSMMLNDYHVSQEKNSAKVTLLSPANSDHPYYAQIGWVAADASVNVPNSHSVWQSEADRISPDSPATLYWENGQGVRFEIDVAMDENFLVTFSQRVINRSDSVVKVTPYSLITRARNMDKEAFLILHEGPLGVFNKELKEVSYSDLMDTPLQSFKQVSGWFGITDKYWLSAFIPDQANGMDVAFKYTLKDGKHRFQTDMIAQPIDVAPYDTVTYTQNLFVGAKKLTLLESYEKSLGTPLFDRSVDFGWLYFITHPLFKVLTILHALVGNFGVAILLLTVVVKLILFPLANKSYKSMYHLKRLQPQLLEIKERYSHDRTMLNREMMALYQDQKVNPMSGCLPIIIQIPVFFALYKVLFITIEMRHAPFFGWVKDLSVLDPTTIFNLFGLIPWDPPSFLSIGVWPILMGVTMYFQQKLNPQPADPIQAKVMKLLPPFFVLIMASFPAGLVIYWTWNNFLSILQQWVITSRLKRQMGGE